MKKTYTILSYNFGNYDMPREPRTVDPAAEYIFVTDKPVKSAVWKMHTDQRLANKDPLYAAYYVRHHPFEYATTDIIITVDASIQINDSLEQIVEAFDKSGADYSVICSIYKSDEHKISEWLRRKPARISNHDVNALNGFIKKFGQENWKGAIGQAFNIYRNTPTMHRFSKHVWRYLMALGENGKPVRIDEIVVHKLLARYNDIKVFPTSMQIIQSAYMTYCAHSFNIPVSRYLDYDQYYYLCNKPVSPYRFDKAVNYPKSYKFKTEAILLTKYLDTLDMVEWVDYHLNVVKFDHLHVFDNTSNSDIKSVCDSYNKIYGDKISYQKVYGHPRQYRLYDAYINNISDAEWVMPIDDDEYLDISDFDSVYDAIKYYDNKLPHMMVLGVRWKHLFPKKFHSERNGNVLAYCTEEKPELAKSFMHLGDTTIKCIVKRYGSIHYEETWENPSGGHVPKHTSFYGAVMCDGRAVLGCGIPNCPEHLEDEQIRLIHCRYKGYSDWMSKYHGETPFTTVSDSTERGRKFKFDELLPNLE